VIVDVLQLYKSQDYRIQSTWKQRHAAMTPLFIDTQSTLATQAADQSTLHDGGVSMSAASAQLRMTVDVHNFTATQADGQTLCLLQQFTYFFSCLFIFAVN